MIVSKKNTIFLLIILFTILIIVGCSSRITDGVATGDKVDSSIIDNRNPQFMESTETQKIILSSEEKIVTLDEAIHEGLIKFSKHAFSSAELYTEGHVIIDTEEENGLVKVFVVMAISNFQFMNDCLTNCSGSGSEPAVVYLKKDNGSYSFVDFEEPLDGGMWKESILELYPERLWDKVLPTSSLEQYRQDIEEQTNTQAENYLESIGRIAEIKLYTELNVQLVNINVNASNKIFSEMTKFDEELNKFPYFIGTMEYLENGERFVYETYQSKCKDGNDFVGFKKTNANDEILSHFGFKVSDNSIENIGDFSNVSIKELPQMYNSQMAIKNGDYVNIHGNIENESLLTEFLDKVTNKQKTSIRITKLTIEGDPVIEDISYDGNIFTIVTDTTRDGFGSKDIYEKQYKNLISYRDGNKILLFITNLSAITEKDYKEGFDGILLN